MAAMDREQYRRFLIQENEKAQNSALWRFLNQQERASTLAMEVMWKQNTLTVNNFLDDAAAAYNQQIQRREDEKFLSVTDTLELVKYLLERVQSGNG